MAKNIVLYIGNFSFPLGNAAGKRVYANGKILRDLGYEVIFIGVDNEVRSTEPLKSTKKKYDDFIYYNFEYPSRNIDWLNYREVFNKLIGLLRDEKVIDHLALVIYYGSPRLSLFNTKLIRFCKAQKIKVIADCVDWLTVKTNNFIFDMVKWIDNNYQKTYVNKKNDGIIAISNYLSEYYKSHGCKTIIIPPLSPDTARPVESNLLKMNGDKKIITYAGIPFRKGQKIKDFSVLKDRIDKTIKLLYKAKKNGCEFIFNIYGFNKDEYLKAIPSQKAYVNELGDSISFHGKKTNMEVVERVKKSDFTILIRDVNRATTAGFPTKISESISCNTPVITTNTSDLENYIQDGKNGFFLDATDEGSALLKLKEILQLDRKEIADMTAYCDENPVFHYKNYVKRFKTFLSSLTK